MGRIRVTRAGTDRLSALASTFGRAFEHERMMRWPLGCEGGVADCFTRRFAYFLEAALPLGLAWEARDAQGAAVWIFTREAEAGGSHPWNQPRIRALTADGGRRYDMFWRWVAEHERRSPAWQLDSIAVQPALHGQGIGRTLIEAGLARARADGIGGFLSTGTSGNVGIYARCGFRIYDEADAPEGGPQIWFMSWDPG